MHRSILARLGYHGYGNPHTGDRNTPGGPPGSVAPPRKPVWAKWRWLVVLVLLAAIALWGLRERWLHPQFHWSEFANSFVDLRWRWIVASFFLGLGTYYGRALRWAVMLRPLKPHPDTWGIFKATAIGFAAVTLLGRPGEFVRPYLISVKERLPFSSQLAVWVLERLCDMLAVLLVFGFAVSQIRASNANLGPAFRWVLQTGGYVVSVLGVACLVLLVMMGRFSGTMQRRLVSALRVLPQRHHERADRMIAAFMDGTASTKSHRSALKLTLYTIFEWALIVLCLSFLFRAYKATEAFTIHDVLIFVGFVSFGSILQIPGVGGGVQLVSILVLTQLYGVSLEVATSQAIMIWIITFVEIVPIGIALAFHEGLNWRKLKSLESCAEAMASPGADSDPVGGITA